MLHKKEKKEREKEREKKDEIDKIGDCNENGYNRHTRTKSYKTDMNIENNDENEKEYKRDRDREKEKGRLRESVRNKDKTDRKGERNDPRGSGSKRDSACSTGAENRRDGVVNGVSNYIDELDDRHRLNTDCRRRYQHGNVQRGMGDYRYSRAYGYRGMSFSI